MKREYIKITAMPGLVSMLDLFAQSRGYTSRARAMHELAHTGMQLHGMITENGRYKKDWQPDDNQRVIVTLVDFPRHGGAREGAGRKPASD